MLTRLNWLAPLIGVLTFSPSLSEEGCGSTGDDDVTPTPVVTPTPSPDLTDRDRFEIYLEDLIAAPSNDVRDQLTADFLGTIQYSGGFPILDGNTATFVYRQESSVKEPLRLSGDFNAWSPTANTMVKPVSGYGLFYATITLSDAHAWSRYKFVGKDSSSQDLWFADPVSRRFQYDSYGKYSLIAGGTQTQPSHLERYPLFTSKYLPSPRDLYLYLPAGYEHEADTYPVIYMHDGQNLFDPNAFYGGWKVDQVIDSLVAQKKMREVMVVGIANTYERMDEYTQVEDFLPAYGGQLGGDAPLYAQLIVEELKPFIDARYRTRPERESTAVLGSSLGGLVSFYIGYAATDVFKYVGGMSSTFGWGSLNLDNETMIETIQNASKLPNMYYLDSGGDDGGGCVDSDGDGVKDDSANSDDNYCETAQMRDVLKAKGYGSSEMLYIYGPGQEHNEASWNSRLHYPLTFWFPAP